MDCDSSYLEANWKEVALSQVACLLDELDGVHFSKSHWRGYHPRVYSMRVDGGALAAELRSKLQNDDVTRRSLEMQIWWRDHQCDDGMRYSR